MLSAMFSGRHNLTKDSQGRYFIDRDGTHFRHILNYLRDGTVIGWMEAGSSFIEILRECRFYGLNGMIDAMAETTTERNQMEKEFPNIERVSPCGVLRIVETRITQPRIPNKQEFTLSFYAPSQEALRRICDAEIFSIPIMRKKIVIDARIPSTCRKYHWSLDSSPTSFIDDVAVSHSLNLCIFESLKGMGFKLRSISTCGCDTTYIFSCN